MRFFNGDMFFRERELNLTVRALANSTCAQRLSWWADVRECRRRRQAQWQRCPIERIFRAENEYELLWYVCFPLLGLLRRTHSKLSGSAPYLHARSLSLSRSSLALSLSLSLSRARVPLGFAQPSHAFAAQSKIEGCSCWTPSDYGTLIAAEAFLGLNYMVVWSGLGCTSNKCR